MRLRLEADPGELAARSDNLIESLAKAVQSEAPSLAAALHKARPLPDVPDQMAYPVLQDLREKWNDAYASQMALMLADIGKVLDKAAK